MEAEWKQLATFNLNFATCQSQAWTGPSKSWRSTKPPSMSIPKAHTGKPSSRTSGSTQTGGTFLKKKAHHTGILTWQWMTKLNNFGGPRRPRLCSRWLSAAEQPCPLLCRHEDVAQVQGNEALKNEQWSFSYARVFFSTSKFDMDELIEAKKVQL